jgi:hypothetical protein
MKRNQILSTVLAALLIFPTLLFAQANREKMERDIEVSTNILNSMIRSSSKGFSFIGGGLKGEYMKDYGVIFEMQNSIFVTNVTRPFTVNESRVVGGAGAIEIRGAAVQSARVREVEVSRLSGTRPDSMVVERPLADEVITGTGPEESREALFETMRTFLLDYSSLFSELKPNEKIVLRSQPRSAFNRFEFYSTGSGGVQNIRQQNFRMEALYQDMMDYKTGKIDKNEALKRITLIQNEEAELAKDVQIFTDIISRLYTENFSKTYFMNAYPRIERLQGLGIVYSISVFSSTEQANGTYLMPTQNLQGVSKAERDKIVKELYPKFEKELKENIIDYGRTIKSLGDVEKLIFNIKLTKCDNCGIPDTIEVEVSNSTLSQYDQNKISREKAISEIKVTKK